MGQQLYRLLRKGRQRTHCVQYLAIRPFVIAEQFMKVVFHGSRHSQFMPTKFAPARVEAMRLYFLGVLVEAPMGLRITILLAVISLTFPCSAKDKKKDRLNET